MKKAFNWSITLIAIIGISIMVGVFIGRSTLNFNPKVTEQTTATQAEAKNANLININTADEELLATLPGIGEVLAKRIVAYREEHGPFISIAHLRAVEGIGTAKAEALLDLICTED